MVQKIHLQNFKNHKDTQISLGNLTLLCGQNGVGKSSMIQSLLLLRQTYQKEQLNKGLSLNKPLCYVGNGKDALFQLAKKNDKIGIELIAENKILKWSFDVQNKSTKDFLDLASNNKLNTSETFNIIKDNFATFSLFNSDFQYISAAREAKYESNDYVVDSEKQLSVMEGRAELTAHFLYKYQNENVTDVLLHPNYRENTTLLFQVTAWEKEISKGIQVHPKKVGGGYEIKYRFDSSDKQTKKEDGFSSKNVGFGISYSLPIIVAILYAKKGSLIIIENPEAHLHPYGQAKLAELLCIAAQAGIQIIIETHSDHILNGVLVQCKKFETEHKGIDRNNVKIWYFEREEETRAAKAMEVEVSENGKIYKAPVGFFDQFGKDLRYLMKNNHRESNG